MAVVRFPTTPWANFASSGSPVDTMTFKLADLPGLTAANATAASGDYVSIAYSIQLSLLNHYTGLTAANRPVAFTPSLTVTPVPLTATQYAGYQKHEFKFVYYVAPPTPTGVAAEPSA